MTTSPNTPDLSLQAVERLRERIAQEVRAHHRSFRRGLPDGLSEFVHQGEYAAADAILAALTPSTVTEGTVSDDGGAPDESSITDAQIADALRHGFGDEAVPADPSREVLTAFAASLDAVPFDTASAAFFSFDTTHGHARVLRRAIRELLDRVETIRPPYQPFWENPDGPQAA